MSTGIVIEIPADNCTGAKTADHDGATHVNLGHQKNVLLNVLHRPVEIAAESSLSINSIFSTLSGRYR
jgi:hypothetical protein